MGMSMSKRQQQLRFPNSSLAPPNYKTLQMYVHWQSMHGKRCDIERLTTGIDYIAQPHAK